jgi:adaptin ear-binding coat-associated protein 1/2
MSKVESIVYINPEVYIYQIPPLKDISGYKASEWEVNEPLWKGRLTVVEIENDQHETWCELRFEDAKSGELFATAPYSSQGKGVMAALDSTRFFAVRVVNGSMTAMLGLGFADRNQAFEFNVALQDFRKHSAPIEETDVKPRDFSLKEGQQIHINVGGGSSLSSSSAEDESLDAGIPALIPPPPPLHSHNRIVKHKPEQESRTELFDDDFGDFVG